MSKIKHKNQHLFSEIERRERSLFVTLTYSNELSEDEFIVTSNQSLNLSEEFSFVAVKNGHHDGTGYVFTNFELKKIKEGNHVKEIGTEIFKLLQCLNSYRAGISGSSFKPGSSFE